MRLAKALNSPYFFRSQNGAFILKPEVHKRFLARLFSWLWGPGKAKFLELNHRTLLKKTIWNWFAEHCTPSSPSIDALVLWSGVSKARWISEASDLPLAPKIEKQLPAVDPKTKGYLWRVARLKKLKAQKLEKKREEERARQNALAARVNQHPKSKPYVPAPPIPAQQSGPKPYNFFEGCE